MSPPLGHPAPHTQDTDTITGVRAVIACPTCNGQNPPAVCADCGSRGYVERLATIADLRAWLEL